MTSGTAKCLIGTMKAIGRTETLVYRPLAGGSRSIQGMVERNGLGAEAGLPPTPGFLVTVLNDATSGIAATELNTGGDQIEVAELAGGETSVRRIGSLESHDVEWTVIRVR